MALDKPYWRKRIKGVISQLSQLPHNEFEKKTLQLSFQLIQLIKNEIEKLKAEERPQFVLGGFFPLCDEPNWTLAFQKDHMISHIQLAFPDMDLAADGTEGNELVFYQSALNDLVPIQKFGRTMMVPPYNGLNRQRLIPHIVLVPGLAFMPDGNRLGRGKGFYDRYLESYPGLKWGICFKEQVIPEFPVNKLDQKVDLVVTD